MRSVDVDQPLEWLFATAKRTPQASSATSAVAGVHIEEITPTSGRRF